MLPLIHEKHYPCAECHRVNSTLVGPSFREVAARRKGHPYAAQLLASKIWNGGTGDYGPTSMPNHMGQVSDEDVNAIAAWILSLDEVDPGRETQTTTGYLR